MQCIQPMGAEDSVNECWMFPLCSFYESMLVCAKGYVGRFLHNNDLFENVGFFVQCLIISFKFSKHFLFLLTWRQFKFLVICPHLNIDRKSLFSNIRHFIFSVAPVSQYLVAFIFFFFNWILTSFSSWSLWQSQKVNWEYDFGKFLFQIVSLCAWVIEGFFS